MDGQVLQSALDDSFLADNPVRYLDSYETPGNGHDVEDIELSVDEREYLEERLRSLGYME
jgi:hypothetical protein